MCAGTACARDLQAPYQESQVRSREERGGVVRRPTGDSKEDIGMHWDKDEDLVDSQGLNVHPQLSTVTYLSDEGAPTMILRKQSSVVYDEMLSAYGNISEGWLSAPRTCKHICFDGRWLHGAPSSLAPLATGKRRITFLANVWMNYQPSGVEIFPDEEIKSFVMREVSTNFSCKSRMKRIRVPSISDPMEFLFGGASGHQHLLRVLLPIAEVKRSLVEGATLLLSFPLRPPAASLMENEEEDKRKKMKGRDAKG
ncbi:hypothetical protein GUITHDRAFT_141584 [Guillardia theta CCMP2712]|uniref:Uncharacterized protein n=1 Tax=Guillardia theta (strain CCMP2712) TaxID=905079 RepID=L1J1V2_GUITC|nr:hypothetical protein GUITHDRAFT_141584 [Guillardia theta CCMP2712]EKX42119.1 hypothetical protein GUITHDRAFT_141584 [Guillardia theta CCMP2712]|eukprot:XP_005829099.1 hypothetical protein GUITHDRAFT_141584 [Guillardia theta CCMP2712]